MWLWLILVGVVVLFLILGFFSWGVKKALWLAINSIIGYFALYAVQLVRPELAINWVNVLITALFGVPGFLIVLLLHFLGVAF